MRLGISWGIWGLLAVWMLGTVSGFAVIGASYLRPVSRPIGARELPIRAKQCLPFQILHGETRDIRLNKPKKITLLNFWNPDCPCSRFMEGHVKKLIAEFPQVQFVTVVEQPDDWDKRHSIAAWHQRQINGTEPVFDQDDQIARDFGVWAAPAAVIISGDGSISYVGAYNATRICDLPETAWAEKALVEVTAGRIPKLSRTVFYGCKVIDGKYECRTPRI